jgi:hypothetical protein
MPKTRNFTIIYISFDKDQGICLPFVFAGQTGSTLSFNVDENISRKQQLFPLSLFPFTDKPLVFQRQERKNIMSFVHSVQGIYNFLFFAVKNKQHIPIRIGLKKGIIILLRSLSSSFAMVVVFSLIHIMQHSDDDFKQVLNLQRIFHS